MKNRLVLWGTNEQEQKVLIALQLLPEEKMVDVFLFPAEIATEEFVTRMHQEWRNGSELEFPAGYIAEKKELTISDSLLPKGIQAERDDLVKRAQTEWQFVILSAKLYQVYQSEIEDIKDKIGQLKQFSSELWEDLRQYWDRVQNQVREKNMFREHADALKEKTNELFTQLKELRKNQEKEFNEKSARLMEQVLQDLKVIEEKIEKGLSLQPIFAELKNLQQRFRDMEFTRDHRSKVWDKLDAAFKAIKEKRFGKEGTAAESRQGAGERIDRRYSGLMEAIDKMQKSIDRDQDELNFQTQKVASSDGQLESQLRQAKINMIEERISSKKAKLDEMHKTRDQLEHKMENIKEKENERQAQQRVEEAKKQAQEKIRQEINAAAEARKESGDKLEKAAEAITGVAAVQTLTDQVEEPATAEAEARPEAPEEKKESLFEVVQDAVSESLQDLSDTVRAAATVIGEKVEEGIDELMGKKEEEE